jgi:hypothetical protein
MQIIAFSLEHTMEIKIIILEILLNTQEFAVFKVRHTVGDIAGRQHYGILLEILQADSIMAYCWRYCRQTVLWHTVGDIAGRQYYGILLEILQADSIISVHSLE